MAVRSMGAATEQGECYSLKGCIGGQRVVQKGLRLAVRSHQKRAPMLSREASSVLAFLRGPSSYGDLLLLEAATLQPPAHFSTVLLLDKRASIGRCGT